MQACILTLLYVGKVGTNLGSNYVGIHNSRCDKDKCLVHGGCNHRMWLYTYSGSEGWHWDGTIQLTCKSRYFAYFIILCIGGIRR